MTTREAVRVLRVDVNRIREWDAPELRIKARAISTILRALSRPTRLEREAAKMYRDISKECCYSDGSGCCDTCSAGLEETCDTSEWLRDYERKAKQ